MALYTELPVYRDTYQLILKVFEYTKEFAKEYKYTHEARCFAFDAQYLSSEKMTNRKEHQEVFLDEFELLKLEIRLCADMKLLSIKKQAALSSLMERIGKQVTGWRNANQHNNKSREKKPLFCVA